MLGSKNRDYKTSDRYITAQGLVHMERTNELIEQGIPKEQASKEAYSEILKGRLNKAIKLKIKKLKNKQNKRTRC